MPLTLEQYADLLEERHEPCPAGPEPTPFTNVSPAACRLSAIRGVIFGSFGTLLLIQGGEVHFLNPEPIMRKIALDKTIHEFKMWASMTRKPGEPSVYLQAIFEQIFQDLLLTEFAGKDAEPRMERIWLRILDRLFQKEYVYDRGQYGDPAAYAQKITYFYLRASQGVGYFPDLHATLTAIAGQGVIQGIFGAGQCNAAVQLWRGLVEQGKFNRLADVFDPRLCLWSSTMGFKAHSDPAYAMLLAGLQARGLTPGDVLFVGSDVVGEIAPAKRRGFKTALLLADTGSAKAQPAHLKDPRTRPDCLLTQLRQLALITG